MLDLASIIETALQQVSAAEITNGVLFLLFAIFFLAVIAAIWGKMPRFGHYTPNLLTSLGILGTFVGIVVGLLAFKVNDIDASIGPLLEGLKTAFITSIAGMCLAIVFKVLDSIGMTSMFRRDKDAVPEHIGPSEIHAELRGQREATERLSWAIAGDEDSALISQIRLLRSDAQDQSKSSLEQLRAQSELQASLSRNSKLQQQSFNEFTDALWNKLDDFAEMLSKSATEQVINALKEVVADFNRNLTEQFGDNFKKLNAAVDELVQWQENYRNQLAEMNEQYAQGVQAITQTANSVTEISEQSRQIPETMSELKAVMETANHQIRELERHLEAFRDMRDRAVEAVPQIRQQMDQMVQDVSAAVKDAGQQIMMATQATHKAIVEGAKDFENRVSRTNEGLTNTSDQLANNSERIREQLAATVKDINASVRAMIAEVTDSSKAIGNNLVDANKRLETSIKEVQYQVTDSIDSMQKRLESALEQVFQAQTREIARTFGALDEELRKSVRTTSEAVNTQLEAIDKAMLNEIERVMQAMGRELAGITQRFTSDYKDLTSQMGQVVEQNRQFVRMAR
ncbi:hypothetical protein [Nitrococcus mobilis]|nr:hypothetical protein [Nitrococcus mobilis]